MPEKPYLLSSKIKIAADPEKPENLSQEHVGFYMHYSSFVFKSLNKRPFQKFLEWMLRKEKIEEHMVKTVNVKIFPLRRKNGKSLAGNCAPSQGKIRIYPKTMTFCRTFKQKFGKNTFLAYAASRARAALIHELLHLRYATDEKRVRELAKEYFFAFTRRTFARDGRFLFSFRVIFMAKHSGFLKLSKTSGSSAELPRL